MKETKRKGFVSERERQGGRERSSRAVKRRGGEEHVLISLEEHVLINLFAVDRLEQVLGSRSATSCRTKHEEK